MAGQGDAAAWPTGLCVLLVRHDSVTVQCFHLFTIPLHPDVAAISLVLPVHSVGLAPKLCQDIVHFLSCLPVSCPPTFTDRLGQPVPVRACPVQCRAEAGALVQCHLHSPPDLSSPGLSLPGALQSLSSHYHRWPPDCPLSRTTLCLRLVCWCPPWCPAPKVQSHPRWACLPAVYVCPSPSMRAPKVAEPWLWELHTNMYSTFASHASNVE